MPRTPSLAELGAIALFYLLTVDMPVVFIIQFPPEEAS